MTQPSDDPYSRVAYRRLVAWERRIRREGPFLTALLESAPDSSVLDLGCGTGEHVAFFAERGIRAVGVDRSAKMIEKAGEHERGGRGRFVAGDLRDIADLPEDEPPFGLAICIGNVIPHLQETTDLDRFLGGLRGRLLPGGVFLLQILNYERIREQGIRHLPVNVRPGDGDKEIVFLRLLKPLDEHRYLFFPTTLELDPEGESPVLAHHSQRVVLRSWTVDELSDALGRAGFTCDLYGGVADVPFDRHESADVVIVARR